MREEPLPGVGGGGLVVVLRAVAEEPVAGAGVDQGVGVVRLDGGDVRHRNIGIVVTEEQQRRAVGRAELACDAGAVEAHRGVEQRHRDRGAVGEHATHAEAGHADLRCAEGAKVGGRLAEIGGRGRWIERSHEGAEVGGAGAAGAEEEVRSHCRVALGRQPLAHPQELG